MCNLKNSSLRNKKCNYYGNQDYLYNGSLLFAVVA